MCIVFVTNASNNHIIIIDQFYVVLLLVSALEHCPANAVTVKVSWLGIKRQFVNYPSQLWSRLTALHMSFCACWVVFVFP